MNKTGWAVTIAAAMAALLFGFVAGWFGGQAYIRSEIEAAFGGSGGGEGAGAPGDLEAMEDYENETGGESGPVVVALGDTHDFGDGITLTVADPYRFTEDDLCEQANADPGCYGQPPIEFVGVTLSVDNTSGEALDMSYVSTSCSVENASADGGFYDELASAPDVLPDGQTAEWTEACEMGADESLLQVTVVVDVREPVTFDGTLD